MAVTTPSPNKLVTLNLNLFLREICLQIYSPHWLSSVWKGLASYLLEIGQLPQIETHKSLACSVDSTRCCEIQFSCNLEHSTF